MRKLPLPAIALIIFLITFYVSLILVGCDCDCHDYKEAPVDKAAVFENEYLLVNGPADEHGRVRASHVHVTKWMYEGHYYIQFHGYGPLEAQGIIHNPKCPGCGNTTRPANEIISDYESVFGTW